MADDDALSLDFTLPGVIEQPPEPTVDLEFHAPEPELSQAPALELVDVDAPPVVSVAPAPASDPAPAKPALPAALIDAALLHAEGKEIEAVRRLETALKSREKLGNEALRVWAGLFDLLQLLNRRPAFDTLSIAFARHFEKSPPIWNGTCSESGSGKTNTSLAGGVALSGALNAGIAAALKQAMALAQTNSEVRIDLAKLTSADNNGATLLMRLVSGLRKARKRTVFINPGPLADIVKPLTISGQRENETLWLLLLELYQQAEQHDPYEETAINYAVTFEVSPPAWVPPSPAARQAPEPANETRTAMAAVGFVLSGIMIDAPLEAFSQLEPLLATQDELEINARELIRINELSSRNLLEVLKQSVARKQIRITGLAPLIAAYLDSLGFADVVELHGRTL